MPVVGALARWGYDWTWTPPRSGEDVNIGAIFRIGPGMLEAPRGVEGAVDFVVEGEGTYRMAVGGGRTAITEPGAESDGPPAAARVTGTVDAWVRALGPDGETGELRVSGNEALADGVLRGFTGAASRRAVA
jgi:hypothetical protein